VKEMKVLLIAEMLLLALMTGCCVDEHKEPAYPGQVKVGWGNNLAKGLQTCGKFILRKGEATDNGRIQVKVLDILSDDLCAHPNPDHSVQVVLQFTRMSDQKILCSTTRLVRSPSILVSDCGNQLVEFGLSGCVVNTINRKKGWVFFELWG
jgi:hypothetical protein